MYDIPEVPGASGEVFVMVSAAFDVKVKLLVAVFARLSVTVTGKVTLPEPGGVPARRPPELSVNHPGNPVADQLFPPTPPEAANWRE
jgi:hypothetical protein